MKPSIHKRIKMAEQKVEQLPDDFTLICEKMTTHELRECLDDNITQERFEELVKEAKAR